MNSKNFWAETKKIIREYADEFEATRRQAYTAALKTIRPGQPAPANDKIIGENYRQAFENISAKYRNRLQTLVDVASADLIQTKTESPSPEALNVLSVLSMRSSLSPEDITDAYQRYGENYLFAKALSDIARDKSIHVALPEHEADNDGALIKQVAGMADEMTLDGAESGKFTPGRLGFIEAMTDASVDVE